MQKKGKKKTVKQVLLLLLKDSSNAVLSGACGATCLFTCPGRWKAFVTKHIRSFFERHSAAKLFQQITLFF